MPKRELTEKERAFLDAWFPGSDQAGLRSLVTIRDLIDEGVTRRMLDMSLVRVEAHAKGHLMMEQEVSRMRDLVRKESEKRIESVNSLATTLTDLRVELRDVKQQRDELSGCVRELMQGVVLLTDEQLSGYFIDHFGVLLEAFRRMRAEDRDELESLRREAVPDLFEAFWKKMKKAPTGDPSEGGDDDASR